MGSLSRSYAQYIQFIENKGQWDKQVRFKGDMVAGAFYLRPTGYTIVQHNHDDLLRITSAYHASGPYDGGTATAARTTATASNEQMTLHSHAVKVSFLNTGSPVLTPEKPDEGVRNYFIGSDPSKWASGCIAYRTVTYKNMYPGIDVRYYTDNGQLKYDIIVYPGADISRLAMQYEGASGLEVKQSGDLVIKTTVKDVTEKKPFTYQLVDGIRREVPCTYFLDKNNTVRFNIADYRKDAILVIDPFLIFSSYSGSTVDNWGYTATYDGQGNMYGGGIVFGQGYPLSTGAYDTQFGGGVNTGERATGFDMGIMKLNAAGTAMIYSTYIGGNGNEQPHSMKVDVNGELVIGGRTISGNFPQTQPKLGPGGDWDIFVCKLSSDGTRLTASRVFGGSGDDGANIQHKYPESNQGIKSLRRNYGDDSRSEVQTDDDNNIIIISCSQSTNFPVTNAFQPTRNEGQFHQDAVVMKLTSDLSSQVFSTYLGGNGDDAAYVVAIDPLSKNLYVAGGTASNDFPGNHAGTVGPANNGGIDGFIAVYTPLGQLIRSTYIGTGQTEQIYGIQFDTKGFVYVVGTSSGSAATMPVINATYSIPGGKQFITKLSNDLSTTVYQTVFGNTGGASTKPNINITAFLVDRCEHVYVSGWGGANLSNWDNSGTRNMPVTSLLPTNPAMVPGGDGNDFYFFVLDKDATGNLYSTIFGEYNPSRFPDHVDGGTSRFDPQGVIYQGVCADCGGGSNFPHTFGAAYPNNGTDGTANRGGCNLAMFKIAFDLAGIGNGVSASVEGRRTNKGCVPATFTLRDTIAIGKTYKWVFGDGSPDVTTTVPETEHTYASVGTYQVMLISYDPATCNGSDTSRTTVRVSEDQAFLNIVPTKLDPCDLFNYQFDNSGSTFPAGKPFQPKTFVYTYGDNSRNDTVSYSQLATHSYASAGVYTVRVQLIDSNYCNTPTDTTFTLRVSSVVRAGFETPPFGCVPYTAKFTNTSSTGRFTWNFDDPASGSANTSNEDSPTHLYSTPGTYNVTLRAEDPNTCNKFDDTTVTIIVSPRPAATTPPGSALSFTPNPPQTNTPVQFFNSSTGANYYEWSFGDGEFYNTANRDTTIRHTYNENTTYNPLLIVTNRYGCKDTARTSLVARVSPLLDVPNAFTPNGDGVNDYVYVRGYGITQMTFRIYNRWGKLVFETTNRKQGWDGRYKGVLQPQDVYAYVLDVTYTGGATYRKTGDITLLR
jgi:gliding motility-associated-like protein